MTACFLHERARQCIAALANDVEFQADSRTLGHVLGLKCFFAFPTGSRWRGRPKLRHPACANRDRVARRPPRSANRAATLSPPPGPPPSKSAS